MSKVQGDDRFMSTQNQSEGTKDSSAKIVWVVIAIVTILIIGGFFWLRKSSPTTVGTDPNHLANAIRPGSSDWDKYHAQIVLDKPEATEGKRTLGDWVMTLQSTARNFTGRTITGLELYGAVVDLENKPVKERTIVVIPTRQPELEPNKTMPVSVLIEGMKDSDVRANIKLEVSGFTLK
jgi:hypothetical protein